MNSSIRRAIVGILSLLVLAAAGAFWVTGPHGDAVTLRYYGLCSRFGPVLFLVWLAWKQLEKLPQPVLIGLPMILVAVLVSPVLLFVAVPLAFLVIVLSHPTKKKKKKRK